MGTSRKVYWRFSCIVVAASRRFTVVVVLPPGRPRLLKGSWALTFMSRLLICWLYHMWLTRTPVWIPMMSVNQWV